jgi:hypothetical protein
MAQHCGLRSSRLHPVGTFGKCLLSRPVLCGTRTLRPGQGQQRGSARGTVLQARRNSRSSPAARGANRAAPDGFRLDASRLSRPRNKRRKPRRIRLRAQRGGGVPDCHKRPCARSCVSSRTMGLQAFNAGGESSVCGPPPAGKKTVRFVATIDKTPPFTPGSTAPWTSLSDASPLCDNAEISLQINALAQLQAFVSGILQNPPKPKSRENCLRPGGNSRLSTPFPE